MINYTYCYNDYRKIQDFSSLLSIMWAKTNSQVVCFIDINFLVENIVEIMIDNFKNNLIK